MKKLLFIVLIIIIALTATACVPIRIIIEYDPPEIEAVEDNGLWNGTQPEYGRTQNGIGYCAADGYKWSNLDETVIGSYLIYLGCEDSIDNWKQVPNDWKNNE